MSWVVFDYGGVLSHLQSGQDQALLARVAGCPAPALASAYWEHRLGYDRGDLDAAMFWQKVASSLGVSFSDAQLAELIRLDIRSWLHLQHETVALAGEVAEAGHRLAMLSNAPLELADAVAAMPFTPIFDELIFSYHLRLTKPDPACFEAALARLGAGQGEVTFLDDRPENVAAAAGAGIRAILFTATSQARADLTGLGLLAPVAAR
jgi:putative hydrolase of the HAD superfamily